MPYTEKQVRVFKAISSGWKPKKGSLSRISRSKAAQMASEGIKKASGTAKALRRR